MTTMREDFLWMLAELQNNATSLRDAAQQRLIDIEARMESGAYVEPVGGEVHVVLVPYNDEPVLAVRTNVEQAVAVAQIFNVDRDGQHAQVLTYATSGVAKGTFVNVEAGR